MIYITARSFFVLVASSVLCVAAAGCGGSPTYDGPERAAVIGKVTFSGQPVETGMITFIPEDSSARTVSAAIGGGGYLLSEGHGPNLGAYKVSISATKQLGDTASAEVYVQDEGDGSGRKRRIKKPEELLPAKYNTETELKADIKSGSNTFDFDLQP